MPKFIFVTGGVVSGLGKGIAAASIGHLLSHKFKVVPIKCDGYLNTDPGTMNPAEHGEVFVLDDGSEVDMDFGHYERYLNCACSEQQSLTMGKVFSRVQQKERKGEYLGKTVQFIPHVTDLIKEHFLNVAKTSKADIVLVEIGGTIGDFENEFFIEAARQLALDLREEDTMFIHLTYVPYLDNVKEQKSKPTQISVRQLLEKGIKPDVIIARSKDPVEDVIKKKIGIFCNVAPKSVFSGHDVKHVYEIPQSYAKQGILDSINSVLKINVDRDENDSWPQLVDNLQNPEKEITIAICGKYTVLEDSYASILESLKHCSAHTKTKINVKMIETTDIESDDDAKQTLSGVDGVIIPGGFGNRGTEGKIQIIKYCRENNLPFLGICLGLQLATIEFARNVCKKDVTSEEFDPDAKEKIIMYLPGQHKDINMGGTMRLGSYEAQLDKDSKVCAIYDGETVVHERHRHRYEVNPDYHKVLSENGLNLAGFSPDKTLVEFICIEEHPYFVATQGHPELKSKFEKPAPLFFGLINAILENK